MKLAILAASPGFNEEWWKQVVPSRNEFGLLLGAAGVITVLALIWAVFNRKRENERPSRYQYPRLNSAEKNGSVNGGSQSEGRKRRRRRRRHRRNPTLAETGGLPPLRHEGLPDDPP